MSICISDALNEPYFICKVSLNQNPETLARTFSSVATQLLEKVKSDKRLTEAYRMEVEFDNYEKVVEFRVSLKTTAWYDVFLQPMDRLEAIKIAKKYTENVMQQFLPEPTPNKKNNNKELEDFNAFDVCYTLKKTGNCNCNSKKWTHPKFLCKDSVETKDARKKICAFYIPDKLLIESLSNKVCDPDGYLFALRRDLFRMFLLVPTKHMENEDLVKLTDFWKFLLIKQQQLSFYLVAFNFGTWESELRNDPNVLECHAHANLYFNEDSWNNAKTVANIPRMDICNTPGPNYLRKNCEELKVYRLNEAYCEYLNGENTKKDDIISKLCEDPMEEYFEKCLQEWSEENSGEHADSNN
ncbi:1179_t:CDS:2 [Paraglomus occultum]|uniref:1179_t:CDS:1 n=1 Tax=Paraglomus occultum TaxID=144539 RepID=A0A9N9AUH6_9GLOM|nr:1179_t:CDS:2 [Paraglomus occultum]